jgi:CubicO group peptidase (beta-lactamase class C family)
MASRPARATSAIDTLDYFHVDRTAPPPNEPQIDKIVNDIINPQGRERMPGVAVAVRKNARVVHLNCYGYADLEAGKKISLETIFDLGSLSKQFTAVAVLNLILGKKLKLTDRLSNFFNDFPRYADAITISDLLHHTSALPAYDELYVQSRLAEDDWYTRAMTRRDHWYPRMSRRKKQEITNEDVRRWIATQTLLPRLPETEFEYCNSGYVVLAAIVAKVTGMRFADFLQQHLFNGLSMTDTYVFDEASRFSSRSRQVANHAKCYTRIKNRFVPVGYTPLNFITGDGNVHSTIVDLLRWELSLTSHEIMGLCFPVHAKKFGGGSSFRDLMWTPTEIKHGKQVSYGAGWYLKGNRYSKDSARNGRSSSRKYESRAEYHRGKWLGWRSYFARASRWPVPAAGKNVDANEWDSLGIVVLSNATFGDQQFVTCRIAQEISRFYWGNFKKDNIMNSFNCG